MITDIHSCEMSALRRDLDRLEHEKALAENRIGELREAAHILKAALEDHLQLDPEGPSVIRHSIDFLNRKFKL